MGWWGEWRIYGALGGCGQGASPLPLSRPTHYPNFWTKG